MNALALTALDWPQLGDAVTTLERAASPETLRRRLVENTIRDYRDGELMTGEALWALSMSALPCDVGVFMDAIDWLVTAEAYDSPDYDDGTPITAFYGSRRAWNEHKREEAERQYEACVARLARVGVTA